MIDDYLYTLNLMLSWFKIHSDDLAKYYEYTMRELVTDYTYKKLLDSEELSDHVENNIIRLIEDNKIFIKEHLTRIGVIKYNLMESYLIHS